MVVRTLASNMRTTQTCRKGISRITSTLQMNRQLVLNENSTTGRLPNRPFSSLSQISLEISPLCSTHKVQSQILPCQVETGEGALTHRTDSKQKTSFALHPLSNCSYHIAQPQSSRQSNFAATWECPNLCMGSDRRFKYWQKLSTQGATRDSMNFCCFPQGASESGKYTMKQQFMTNPFLSSRQSKIEFSQIAATIDYSWVPSKILCFQKETSDSHQRTDCSAGHAKQKGG